MQWDLWEQGGGLRCWEGSCTGAASQARASPSQQPPRCPAAAPSHPARSTRFERLAWCRPTSVRAQSTPSALPQGRTRPSRWPKPRQPLPPAAWPPPRWAGARPSLRWACFACKRWFSWRQAALPRSRWCGAGSKGQGRGTGTCPRHCPSWPAFAPGAPRRGPMLAWQLMPTRGPRMTPAVSLPPRPPAVCVHCHQGGVRGLQAAGLPLRPAVRQAVWPAAWHHGARIALQNRSCPGLAVCLLSVQRSGLACVSAFWPAAACKCSNAVKAPPAGLTLLLPAAPPAGLTLFLPAAPPAAPAVRHSRRGAGQD